MRFKGKSWLSWGSSKAESAASDARSSVEDAKSSASALSSRISSEIAHERDAASQKAADVVDFTKNKASDLGEHAGSKKEEVKGSGKSWWSWGSSKAGDAVEGTKGAAVGAKDKVAGLRDGAYDAGDRIKEQAGDAAVSAKEGVKSGLLSVEEATERGAQRAQTETKKL